QEPALRQVANHRGIGTVQGRDPVLILESDQAGPGRSVAVDVPSAEGAVPNDGHKPDASLDQAARQQETLAILVAAVAVAHHNRLELQVKGALGRSGGD